MADASLYIDVEGEAWRPSPYEGVTWKKLHFDRDTGESAVLLRFEPGAAYAAHRHPKGEQYLVLEGSLQDGGRTYGAGTYVNHPPGSTHKPRSAEGCLIFVTLNAPIEDLEATRPNPA
ncbi:MAG: cupin domain-containing protein [Planctomycetota bacterium]|nr:cupin domain-containing protein [Planctomycetota bacterium]